MASAVSQAVFNLCASDYWLSLNLGLIRKPVLGTQKRLQLPVSHSSDRPTEAPPMAHGVQRTPAPPQPAPPPLPQEPAHAAEEEEDSEPAAAVLKDGRRPALYKPTSFEIEKMRRLVC